ncbi:unnamed protein product, partial [Ectocarpus sp. 13 AM-2016]
MAASREELAEGRLPTTRISSEDPPPRQWWRRRWLRRRRRPLTAEVLLSRKPAAGRGRRDGWGNRRRCRSSITHDISPRPSRSYRYLSLTPRLRSCRRVATRSRSLRINNTSTSSSSSRLSITIEASSCRLCLQQRKAAAPEAVPRPTFLIIRSLAPPPPRRGVIGDLIPRCHPDPPQPCPANFSARGSQEGAL